MTQLIRLKQIERPLSEDPTRGYRFFDDAMSVTSNPVFANVFAGAGAAVLSRAAYAPTSQTWGGAEVGIYGLALGTTATGRAAYITPTPETVLGFGVSRFSSATKFVTLSVAASRYVARIGYLSTATAEPVDGVYFRYSDNLNAGNMQCVCRAGGVETAVNTAQPVSAIAYKLEIVVNAFATSAQFFMSGALVATVTTNIPKIITRPVGFGIAIIRSVGTTATTPVEFDYIDAQCTFTSPRL